MEDRHLKRQNDRKKEEGAALYIVTYGDLVTLLLCFFVLLINPPVENTQRIQLIMASLNRIGILEGGNTQESAPLSELGNNVMALPSVTLMRRLDKSRQKAMNVFHSEQNKENFIISEDQRGLVISLTGDLFFLGKTADLNMQNARPVMQRLASLLGSREELSGKRFRIEGHTNSIPPGEDSPYQTNWELSVARSLVILHHLVNLGVDERNFEIAGFADTLPLRESAADLFEGNTTEMEERVDIVVLRTGHR